MGQKMVQILVRKLDDTVAERLRARARRDGHSLEEECRRALTAAANEGGLLAAVASWRQDWPDEANEDEDPFANVRQRGSGRAVELE